MACSMYRNGICKSGFPVSTGCFATGNLEKTFINGVHCAKEDWCAKTYESNGGKPFLKENLELVQQQPTNKVFNA